MGKWGAPEGNNNAVGNSGGAPEGNTRGLKHGVLADPSNLFKALSDSEKEWIGQRTYEYLQIAPFDREDPRAERLAMTIIMCVQEWRGRERILADDLSESRPIEDKNGDVIGTVTDEHHLSRHVDRLNDKIRMNLKDMGFVGPNSDISRNGGVDQVDQSLAEWLSDQVIDADPGDSEAEALDPGDSGDGDDSA